MRRCFDSKQWYREVIAGLILYPLVIAFFATMSVIGFSVEVFGFAIISLLISIFIAVYGFFDALYQWRRYSLLEDAIVVEYFGVFRQAYPWHLFKEIVVCDISHASRFPNICQIVIRLSVYDEFNNPHSGNMKFSRPHIERWRSSWYNQIRFQKIVCLTFSPDRLIEIETKSNLPVRYALTIYGEEALAHNN